MHNYSRRVPLDVAISQADRVMYERKRAHRELRGPAGERNDAMNYFWSECPKCGCQITIQYVEHPDRLVGSLRRWSSDRTVNDGRLLAGLPRRDLAGRQLRDRLRLRGAHRGGGGLRPAGHDGEAGRLKRVPVEDSFDLHAFRPEDAVSAAAEYLREARAAGFREVRLVHGKGIGVRRAEDPAPARFPCRRRGLRRRAAGARGHGSDDRRIPLTVANAPSPSVTRETARAAN